DNTAPTSSVTAPAENGSASGNAGSVTAAASDGTGSGVDTVKFQFKAHAAATWTDISTDSSSPYAASWDTSALSDGSYDLRVLATDNVGNSAASAAITVKVDNTAPTSSVTAPA